MSNPKKFSIKDKLKSESEAIPAVRGEAPKTRAKTSNRTSALGNKIDPEIHKKMKLYALENGMSIADLIEQAATEYMSKKA